MKKLFLLSLSIAIGFTIKAQESVNDTIQIEEVVVTGSQVKINKNNSPFAITVVNSEQIEETDESALLSVLSGRVPGLFVTERGVTGYGVADGSAGQISIRGIGGSPTTGVLMLIDGHPQFMGIMGHPLPDSYVASDVERVEVIRGPGSVLYGSNAMGGVINIITKKQNEDKIHGNARVMYGAYNTQKYLGSLGYKKDKLSLFGSINRDQTDGHRPNSEFAITNGYVKAGYAINSNFYATADFSLASFDANDPGPDTEAGQYGDSIDILRGYGAVSLQNEFQKSSGALKFFYNFGEHDITSGFHSIDHNFGLNLYQSFELLEGNLFTLGADYMNYGGLAENVKAMMGNGIVLADTSITELGFYGLVQQKIADKFAVNAGLRFQNNSIYGSEWIPSAGATYNVNSTTNIKANFSKGYRSPTMRELFLFPPQNANLLPESIINYELGVEQYFFGKKLRTELTIFALNGDNMIVGVPVNGVFKYMNAGSVNNQGIEIAANANPINNLKLHATYSYIMMETPVYATPKNHLFVSATYKLNKLMLSANVQSVNDLDNDPTPIENLESYTLLNAKVAYSINENLKAFVSGENLLGAEYQVNRYYTMPGTTMFAGVNFTF